MDFQLPNNLQAYGCRLATECKNRNIQNETIWYLVTSTFFLYFTGEFLLRLAHLYAVGEDENLSQNVTVDLGNLFTNLQPISYVETSLTGNQPISEMKRLQWNVAGESKAKDQRPEASGWSIVLTPMSFRTFLVRYLFG